MTSKQPRDGGGKEIDDFLPDVDAVENEPKRIEPVDEVADGKRKKRGQRADKDFTLDFLRVMLAYIVAGFLMRTLARILFG